MDVVSAAPEGLWTVPPWEPRRGSRADAAILTEPTSMQIWNAQVGVLWFSLLVAGRPAHAAYATTGENAIEAT